MDTLADVHKVVPLKDIKQSLQRWLKNLPANILNINTQSYFLRFQMSCESVDLLKWLAAQSVNPKMFWADRNGQFEVAGIGEADVVGLNFECMGERLSEDSPYLRYYGGVSFSSSALNSVWEKFGAARFWVSRFEFFKEKGECFIACNVRRDEVNPQGIDKVLDQWETIEFSFTQEILLLPRYQQRHDMPNRQTWGIIFSQVEKGLSQGQYEKIVLARQSVLKFDQNINAMAVLEQLRLKTPNCFHFCFQLGGCPTTSSLETLVSDNLLDNDVAFLGASPERLYQRQGKEIWSEAIAGTRPRGNVEEDDQRLCQELLDSNKDAREHQYVVDAIKNNFEKICESFQYDHASELLELNGGHHLITCFNGTLCANMDDARILCELHPTPAVAGCPTVKAVEEITNLEPFDRGWYAGPVGYVGHDDVEFAVAIRSGLVQGQELSVYAGAGIVKGSTVQEEWQEIENKVGGFVGMFE